MATLSLNPNRPGKPGLVKAAASRRIPHEPRADLEDVKQSYSKTPPRTTSLTFYAL